MEKKKVGILFDSSCGFTKVKIEEEGNFFVPIMVEIGGKEYKSGIDLNNEILFEKFKEFKDVYKTSAVNVGDFVENIDKALEVYEKVVVITISHFISSTNRNLNHFVMTEPKYKDNVVVYESNFLTPWIQFFYEDLLSIQADENGSLQAIINLLDYYSTRQKGYLAPDNLERLRIGGRLSDMQYRLAKALKIHPILEVINGDLGSAKVFKVRKKERIVNKLADLVIEEYNTLKENNENEDIQILYVNNDNGEMIQMLKEEVESKGYKIGKETLLSPEINAHVGDKAFGIGAIVKKDWKLFL